MKELALVTLSLGSVTRREELLLQVLPGVVKNADDGSGEARQSILEVFGRLDFNRRQLLHVPHVRNDAVGVPGSFVLECPTRSVKKYAVRD